MYGNRSENAVFSEAIRFVLIRGPQTTPVIHEQVRQLEPDLCNDSEELISNGKSYGMRWKRQVRNAQQFLKRRGEATYDDDTRLWALA